MPSRRGSLLRAAIGAPANLAPVKQPALPALMRFLESPNSRVRAAAAATIIRLGWGIGYGSVSQVAHAILEDSLMQTA